MTAPAHWPDGPLLSTPGLPMSDCYCWHNHPHRECLEHGQSDEIDAILDVIAWDEDSTCAEWLWEADSALRSTIPANVIRRMFGSPVRP